VISIDAAPSSVLGESAPSAESIPQASPVPPEAVASSPVSEIVPALGDIPEPPAIPPSVEELVETLPLSGEPSFASLGLGGWSPVGIVQNCMEYLHIGCDLPWWISIAIGNSDDRNEVTFVLVKYP
jgi:YidC/Oxa1 family membrane protein insertase